MTYQAALDYIHGSRRFGIKLGLDNMRALLNALDNPQKKLSFIHVAGTSGKGSTSSFIASVLKAAGYRVGKYISPFITIFNERIQIDDIYIGDDDLALHASMVKDVADKLVDEQAIHPTEFEIVTAIGMLYFASKKVDVVVLEVGLGGRFDATNVIDCPLAAVITPVSLDHTQYLGETLDKVGYEKAGIIKQNCLVVSTLQTPEVEKVIDEKVASMSATLVISNHHGAQIVAMDKTATHFDYRNLHLKIALLGRHQVQNACTAIDTLFELRARDKFEISDAMIVKGLSENRLSGRFEIIYNDPTVIIDGAHNGAKIDAFLDAIRQYQPTGRRIGFFGMMKDKDVASVVKQIALYFDALYLVEPNNPRAVPPLELKRLLQAVDYRGEAHVVRDLKKIRKICEKYKKFDVVIYGFGSLYFIGDMRKQFIND